MKLVRNILAALILACLGVFILREYQTTVGLAVGAGCVFLALGIAFPTQLREGLVEVKAGLVLIVPVIVDALKGGNRKSDPPADP